MSSSHSPSKSSDLAVRVRGLGKQYTISKGQNSAESTLTETLLRRARNPFARAEKDSFWALKDIDFDIKKGDVVGIIGRNGAGKSTLLKVLSQITEPTTGEIQLFGRVGSLLEVGTGFHPELTGRENIFLNGAILGMTRAEIKKQFDAIVDFSGVEKFLDTPVKRYSSGMYVRLAFAVAAHLETEILIIDEVLAVGDQEFQNKCLGKMKDVAEGGRTVLFVSHNMAAVKELCNSAVFLVKGQVNKVGRPDEIIREYLDKGAADEVRPERGPLKRARIRQCDDMLVIDADWAHTDTLPLPNLGFVIYDYMGSPIAGSNAHLSGVDRLSSPRDSGHIEVRLAQPRLLDGEYYLSLWFGDGAQNFVELPKCISFEVRGMAGKRQHPAPAIAGPVAPFCKYDFT